MDTELTLEEKSAIKALESLAKRWPKTLWLYSYLGELHVMKATPDGQAVRVELIEGIDNEGEGR